ncbi:MAG: hypothetical protein ABSB60_13955 [Terracidiphilus sp.]|jgi:hypothetical protein
MIGEVFAGETVRFWLSPEGISALSGVFEKPSFAAHVAGADELGVWIDFGDQSVVLLKWHYLATAVVSVPPPENVEPAGKRIGFVA